MKNMVTSGDYAGSLVVGGGIAKTAGAIMKGGYQVKIIFKDGKKSLLDIDESKYKAIIQACF